MLVPLPSCSMAFSLLWIIWHLELTVTSVVVSYVSEMMTIWRVAIVDVQTMYSLIDIITPTVVGKYCRHSVVHCYQLSNLFSAHETSSKGNQRQGASCPCDGENNESWDEI